MPEELKDIVLRLERLEQSIGTIARKPKVSELSAEDVAAYHRVQSAFWEDGSCGINETSPCYVFRCNVVSAGRVIPIPKPCDFECSCGPCNFWGPAVGGGYRFRGMGGG